MILIITHEKDAHGAHIVDLLKKHGERVGVLNYGEYPCEMEISFSISSDNDMVTMQIPGGGNINGTAVKSVLNRRQADPTPSANIRDPLIVEYVTRESRNFLDALPNILDCFWLSNPDATRIASRKPHHLKIAKQLGFQIPTTLITNSPGLVEQFAISAGCADIACKTLWTPGITIGEGSQEKGVALYTRRIKAPSLIRRNAAVKNCPTIFQHYTEKAFELRITVVGQRVFACAIHSQKSALTREDWRRYDLENTPHEPYELPKDIEARCASLVKMLGLSFGCIDMIVTPDGEYVFLEINPNGQWLWIEHLTGLAISEEIVKLLINPPK